MTVICPIQTTRNNPDSCWSLINIVGSVSIPTQLAESGYDIVWISKYVYKVVSSVDGYVRVYTRRNTRIYSKKNLVWIFVSGVLQEINKRIPKLPTTNIEAMGINCRDKVNISIKTYIDSNHLVGNEHRLHNDVLSPHNPNIPQRIDFGSNCSGHKSERTCGF